MINNSTIELFGRTIFLTHNTDCSLHSSLSASSPLEVNSSTEHKAKRYKETLRKELIEDEASLQTTEDSESPTSSSLIENPKTPSSETETSQPYSTKIDEQTDISQEIAPKKPDQVVPCPRCKSTDTKFCYYNNYNVKQPRHFCKNCQRYWTSGGTTRNMLIGAGRRKNKISSFHSDASHYHQMSTVLSFGSDSPIMSSTSLDKKGNVGSLEKTFDKSYRSFP